MFKHSFSLVLMFSKEVENAVNKEKSLVGASSKYCEDFRGGSLTALVFTWDERMGMSLARGRLTEAGDTNPESEWWRLALVGPGPV